MEIPNFKKSKIKVETMMIRIRDRAAMRLRMEKETMEHVAKYMDKRDQTLQQAFKYFDTDLSGSISLDELKKMFEIMKIPITT
jgi:Ca2+-binding EF-hand superfamily protein